MKPEKAGPASDAFVQLVEKLHATQVWLDERNATPIDWPLLRRYWLGQTDRRDTQFVVSQITSFLSWRDAFLKVVAGDRDSLNAQARPIRD